MELNDLHNKFLAEGFNRFFIEGIGGPCPDDVEVLGKIGPEWAVYYVERGQKSKPLFSSTSLALAIEFYYNHIASIEHWHLIAFTRSKTIVEARRAQLENLNIRVIQNDIPHYSKSGDCVYRLFVVNKDIFKANDLFEDNPYYDEDLR